MQIGVLPAEANSTHLVQIPKKHKPKIMVDFKPIALTNLLYKIVAKVLVNRMKPFSTSSSLKLKVSFVSRHHNKQCNTHT